MMETYESEYNTLYNMNTGRETLKRKMTLDLNNLAGGRGGDEGQQASVIKKARVYAAGGLQTPIYTASDILNSPGFKNVPTPDLEYALETLFPKSVHAYAEQHQVQQQNQQQRQMNNGYMLNNHIIQLQTVPQQPPPTYSLLTAPTQTQTYTSVNSQYAASGSSGDSDDSISENSMTSSTNSTYNTNGQYGRLPEYTNVQQHGYGPGAGILIKEEPVEAQHGHDHTPIDMANQERIKLERKRQRNRVAASKCRKRKLEKISKLEEKVAQLKKENAELTGVMNKLSEGVQMLKEQVRSHAAAGCQIMVSTTMNQHYN